MEHKAIGGKTVDWIDLAADREKWRELCVCVCVCCCGHGNELNFSFLKPTYAQLPYTIIQLLFGGTASCSVS
jgi:hypothetical protein